MDSSGRILRSIQEAANYSSAALWIGDLDVIPILYRLTFRLEVVSVISEPIADADFGLRLSFEQSVPRAIG